MTKIFGWDPTTMREREDAFAARVDKLVMKLGQNAIQIFKANKVIVAAGSKVPAAPVELGELGAITGMWKGFVSVELMPLLSDTYLEAAGVIWQGIDDAFDDLVVPPVSDVFAEEYLASASNRLVGIGDHVWTKVREQLLTGFSLGESTIALAARVQQAAQVSQARANVIARTEANMAANAGSFQQVLVSGLTGTKEWLDTHDERTRCTHRAAGGQTVDILTPFTLGGGDCGEGLAYLMVPGDPTAPPSEIIQCRCSVAFDLSLDEESLVAADREYVRDAEGKFAETPDMGLSGQDALDAITHPLTTADVKELDAYTGNGYHPDRMKYRELNDRLRNGGGPLDSPSQQKREVDSTVALDEVIAKGEVTKPITTYRGLEGGEKILGDLRVGDTFSDKAFMSTTADSSIASDIYGTRPGAAVMRIHIPVGAHAAKFPTDVEDAGARAHYTKAQEVLLPRDTKLRVVKIGTLPGSTTPVYDLEVVLS